ncbi:MAG: iron-containing alcohol dehydrogenase [Desulfurococcales archaeon]|nr:iron-containing alcohol dehydrogenase [Desulfurococcales archaeon]
MPELGFPRRVILGERASDAVQGLLTLIGGRRVLLVSDPWLSKTPGYRSLLGALMSQYDVLEFSEVEPEPGIETALKAAEHARGVDAVIAYGGGSVIDVAKAATVLAKRPGMSVENIAPFNILGIELEKPILIAVPTTSGTGSDASYGIVLSKHVEGVGKVKIAVGSFEVIPFATVLDPELPSGAPERVKIGAVVDALTHAVESLACTNTNPISEALAEKAVALIFQHAPKALKEGDRESWEALHAAATMAGMAFTNSGLGLAHAIAHPLGGLLGTHHGTTVGITLLGVLPLYEKTEGSGERLERLKKVLEHLYGQPPSPDLRAHIERLYREIGQPLRFRELGIERDKYEKAAEKAAELAYHDPEIAFSPVIPEVEGLRELIMSLY